jgi:hypothetical protein
MNGGFKNELMGAYIESYHNLLEFIFSSKKNYKTQDIGKFNELF